jgi:hypothetical protein
MIELITNFFKRISGDYGNALDAYITARNPQNEGDVERYTVEYHNKIMNNRYY